MTVDRTKLQPTRNPTLFQINEDYAYSSWRFDPFMYPGDCQSENDNLKRPGFLYCIYPQEPAHEGHMYRNTRNLATLTSGCADYLHIPTDRSISH